MKLVTWNVNSIKVRLPRILEFLEAHSPTVLCLQETKCNPEAFPHGELAAAGYHAVEHSGGRWAGVAILAPSDVELTDPVKGLPGEPDPQEARFVEASVDGHRFASVYVPNGRAPDAPQFPDKLRFLEALAQHAARLDGAFGDLNVTRCDRDVYDPQAFVGDTHVTDDERSRLEAVIDAGLRDSFRELDDESQGFTWWDYRQGHFHRGLGLRIDYALLAPTLAERLISCGIDRGFRKGTKPSDHAPLIAQLRD